METVLSFLQKPVYFLGTLAAFVLIMAFVSFKIGCVITSLRLKDQIRKSREDSIKRSRAVIGGQVSEQLAPFLPDFPCNPADVRFVGKPIDFVAFPGAADEDEIKEIILIEVKTGSSQLSKREREIRDCVAQGKVRYEIYRV